MSASKFVAIVLAAGKSKRMRSALPKAVHLICGKPMTRHVIDACRAAGASDVVVVVGHQAEAVRESLGPDVTYALQAEQLGTGHAARIGLDAVPEATDPVVVLPGDAPLVTPETLRRLVDVHLAEANAVTLLTTVLPGDAGHYGRVLRDSDGSVRAVIESKDAPPDVLAIREINTSIYAFDACVLREKLELIKPENAQAEYYLTDAVALIAKQGLRTGAVVAPQPEEVLGINTRIELAAAIQSMRARILDDLMLSGVTIIDPATTYVDVDVEVGRDTVIMPCTVIERGCRIGSGCKIGPFVRLSGAVVEDGTTVESPTTSYGADLERGGPLAKPEALRRHFKP